MTRRNLIIIGMIKLERKKKNEEWVNDQNFMSADSAKQFIQEQLELTVSELVDKKIDEALDKKIGGLESTDIANIFN